LQFSTSTFLNGTMGVNTTGIQTNANCANPNQISVTSSSANSSTLSATSVDGCTLQATFNPNNADQQYGVSNVPNCGANTTDVSFQPVRQSFSSAHCQFKVFIIVHRFSSGFGKMAETARPEFFAGRKYGFSM
jgi:hypothetical protein